LFSFIFFPKINFTFDYRISNRGSVKLNEGSLSDTQTYGDVKTDYSSYAMWLKHSNTASSRLSEGDALEQMTIIGGSPNIGRSHKLMQQSQQHIQSPRLNRSNSIRYITQTNHSML
jgi:predicted ATP-dependent serine protease